jgi:hypothetical protein
VPSLCLRFDPRTNQELSQAKYNAIYDLTRGRLGRGAAAATGMRTAHRHALSPQFSIRSRRTRAHRASEAEAYQD